MTLVDCKYERYISAELVSIHPSRPVNVIPVIAPMEMGRTIEIWGSGYSTLRYQGELLSEMTNREKLEQLSQTTNLVFGALTGIFAIIALFSFIVAGVGVGIAALGPLMASLVGLVGFAIWKRKNSDSS